MDDFEERMDKIFEKDEQIRVSARETNSVFNKQIGLKSSIAILGSVLGLVGFGVYYLVVVLEVTK